MPNYQTRVPHYDTRRPMSPTPSTPRGAGRADLRAALDLPGRLRQIWPQRRASPGFTAERDDAAAVPPRRRPGARASRTTRRRGVDWGWSGAPDTSGTTRSCRRRYVETHTTYETRYRWTSTSYEAESVDVSELQAGQRRSRIADQQHAANDGDDANDGYVPTPGVYDATELRRGRRPASPRRTVTWNGCIEERDTVNTITPSSDLRPPDRRLRSQHQPHPARRRRRGGGRCSRQIVLSPDRPARRRPTTGTSMATAACPAAARAAHAWTRGEHAELCQRAEPDRQHLSRHRHASGARGCSPTRGIFADSPDTFQRHAGHPPHHLHDRRPDGHRSRRSTRPTASSATTCAISRHVRARPRAS